MISFYDSNKIEEDFKSLKEAINFVENKVNTNITKLQGQIEIKPIQQLDSLKLDTVRISLWEDSGWYSSKKIRIDYNNSNSKFLLSEEGLKSALEFIDKIAQEDTETHTKNIEKCASNNETYTALSNLLTRIGIKDKYYGYKTNRSSKKESLYYNWPTEIFGQIPRSYSSNKINELVKKYKDNIQKYYDDEMKKIKAEADKKEAERKVKEQNKKLALLLAKYDLDLNCDWKDLLDIVINKNKYLYLAHYLMLNRGDWNDGYSFAETGLSGFDVKSNLDQEIYNDIQSYIDGWDGDGRVFRDCEYNYGVLYGMVSEQSSDLYKDYQVINENIERF